MKFFGKSLVFILLAGLTVFSQESARTQKLQKIEELNKQIKVLEEDVLLPDVNDLKQAKEENVEVFRLMPRELYDGKLKISGGGGYYSFTSKSHDYQKIPQIELGENYLSVGFAGADYGFLYDLGDVQLSNINKETNAINFLVNYKPPVKELDVRAEQRKSNSYQSENIIYKRRIPVIVGHVYILRAINFDNADVLTAFKIHRKDADGSLIIFWKMLETFEKPTFTRNEQASLTSQPNTVSSAVTSGNLVPVIEAALRKKGFSEVKIDVSTSPMTLRGTVPKGKLAEVISTAQEVNGGKPVINELTEK